MRAHDQRTFRILITAAATVRITACAVEKCLVVAKTMN